MKALLSLSSEIITSFNRALFTRHNEKLSPGLMIMGLTGNTLSHILCTINAALFMCLSFAVRLMDGWMDGCLNVSFAQASA